MIERITATCWLNEEDFKAGNAQSLSYAWAPKLSRGMLPTLLGASLPAPVAKGTTVDVKLSAGGVWVMGVRVIDKGPWRTNDPFWRDPARPQSEQMVGVMVGWSADHQGWYPRISPAKYTCNGAGLDLTPAVWERLYGAAAGSLWTKSPSGLVDLVVHEAGRNPTNGMQRSCYGTPEKDSAG